MRRRSLGNWILVYAFAVLVFIIVAAPVIWLFISSISTQSELLEHPLKTREAVSARASSLDAVFFIMFLLKYKSQRS